MYCWTLKIQEAELKKRITKRLKVKAEKKCITLTSSFYNGYLMT